LNVGQSPGATLGGDATAAEGAGAECAQDITTGTDIASVGLVSRIRILGDRATMRRVGAVRERTLPGALDPLRANLRVRQAICIIKRTAALQLDDERQPQSFWWLSDPSTVPIWR